jgi:sterol desaturase/sphingolipid hydroxylase (fatty acid hydroxylase superfamily)
MKMFAVPFGVMLMLVLAEAWVLRHRGASVCWHDTVLNLNSGHLLMLVLRGVEVAGYAWLLQHASAGWVARWPAVAQWAFAFFAWDFCFYWLHRLHHKLPLFWAVHVVHHEGEHFNLSLGMRNSWFSSLSSLPFFAALAVLGLPLHVFVLVGGLHYSVQFYNHNGLVRRSGWLDRWFVTPRHHRVHHGCNEVYIDRNFGGTLLIWDKLFGTFQPERPDTPVRFGVHAPTRSHNPLWANLVPFARLFGWHQWTAPAASRSVSGTWVAAGGVLLYVLALKHLRADEMHGAWAQAASFGLVFVATLALGAASDGRPWGWWAWAALGALAMPAFAGLASPWPRVDGALACAWALHAAWAWRARSAAGAAGAAAP